MDFCDGKKIVNVGIPSSHITISFRVKIKAMMFQHSRLWINEDTLILLISL
jgi:hypothetical protein